VLKASPSNTLHRAMKEIELQLYQRICAYELDDPRHQMGAGWLAQLLGGSPAMHCPARSYRHQRWTVV
jgi:hypothetical protein